MTTTTGIGGAREREGSDLPKMDPTTEEAAASDGPRPPRPARWVAGAGLGGLALMCAAMGVSWAAGEPHPVAVFPSTSPTTAAKTSEATGFEAAPGLPITPDLASQLATPTIDWAYEREADLASYAEVARSLADDARAHADRLDESASAAELAAAIADADVEFVIADTAGDADAASPPELEVLDAAEASARAQTSRSEAVSADLDATAAEAHAEAAEHDRDRLTASVWSAEQSVITAAAAFLAAADDAERTAAERTLRAALEQRSAVEADVAAAIGEPSTLVYSVTGSGGEGTASDGTISYRITVSSDGELTVSPEPTLAKTLKAGDIVTYEVSPDGGTFELLGPRTP